MGLNYNYIYFNSLDGAMWKNYPDGYFTICVEDLTRMEGVEVVSAPLYYASTPVRYLFALHNSQRYNLPLKSLWYPFYFKNAFKENKPLCFVFQRIPSLEYILFLKKKYPNAKFVKVSRDLLCTQPAFFKKYSEAKCFDIWMSFDEGDAEKYGMPHFAEIESKTSVPKADNYPLHDVFFAGKAKDRLPRLLEAYDILTKCGYKCFFYITGTGGLVSDKDGVVYANRDMSYREMLYHTVNSRCVLEINQENAQGYTSRFLEAVIYGKKLITDNVYIKKSKFYNPKHIQVINYVSEINPSFIESDGDRIDYNYSNEFSPVLLIQQIEGLLTS